MKKVFSIAASLVAILMMCACSGQESTIEGTALDVDPVVVYNDYDGYSIAYILQGKDTIGQIRMDLKYLTRTRSRDSLGTVALMPNYPVMLENGTWHWVYDDTQEADLKATGCKILEAEYKDYSAVPQSADQYRLALNYGVRLTVEANGQNYILSADLSPRYYQIAVDAPDPDPIVSVQDYDGYSITYIIQGDDTLARIRFDLEKLEIKREKAELGTTAPKAGYPFLEGTIWRWQYVDEQVGNLSATGCTISSAEYLNYQPTQLTTDRVQLALRHQVKGEVTTKGGRKYSYDAIMAPRYYQYAITYAPTLDWSISTTATQTSLTCKIGVEASDGSFKKVYSWKAALAGLESYKDTLYVGSTTEVTTGNYTGVLANEVEEKWSKDSVWYAVKKNLQTRDAAKFIISGKEVGPNHNIDYFFTSVTCFLPSGETILWEVIPETTVDEHTYTDEGLKTFTMNDGSIAEYWQTLHTAIHHYLTIKVTYQGETKNIDIPCLTAVGGGKYILCENTCPINIFVKN
jgi:hypothetical protein